MDEISKNIRKHFFQSLDSAIDDLIEILNTFQESLFLQDYFFKLILAFTYGNYIRFFFDKLTQENVKELNLPKGQIGEIKKCFVETRNLANKAISLKINNIEMHDYIEFKKDVNTKYPDFIKIFNEIEKVISLDSVEKYLSKAKIKISKTGKNSKLLHDSFITFAVEKYIEQYRKLPIDTKFSKILTKDITEIAPEIADIIMEGLDEASQDMLLEQRQIKNDFEQRLLLRWKDVLDLLECFIRVSLEAGEEHQIKLYESADTTNLNKYHALFNIHARALKISNEILVLLKSGYADGANARWRTLHELAIIALFISKEKDEISKRYLDHAIVRSYKEATHYKIHHRKLGYRAIDKRTFQKMKKDVEELDKLYGDDFGSTRGDFNWIPKSILKARNFFELEKYVNVSHLRPYYNLSCDSVHAGSKGFYSLGVMDNLQGRLLLAGASNYGLADPIQNTALSLLHISVTLLTLNPNFDSIIQMKILVAYVDRICPIAISIQKQIEQEDLLYY